MIYYAINYKYFFLIVPLIWFSIYHHGYPMLCTQVYWNSDETEIRKYAINF